MSNWDTVSIVSIALVNKALGDNAQQLISDFEFEGADDQFSAKFQCIGTFGAWSLDEGSAGDLLRLKLPITQGTISASNDTIDLSGTTAIMEVSFDFLPGSPTTSNFVFSLKNNSKLGDPPQPGYVTPIDLVGPIPILEKLGIVGKAAVLNGIAAMICSKASEISYIFARLNVVSPDAQFWLAPIRSTYTYYSVDGTRGFLAIVSVITDRPVAANIDAKIFPDPGSDMSFAITNDLFLQHLIIPVLPLAYGGNSSINNFGFDSGNHKVFCSSAFNINSVTSGAITYDPIVTGANVKCMPEGISISTNGYCDLKAGISMTYSASCNPTLNFDPVSQSISFNRDPNPVVGHDVDIPWYWWLGGLIVEAVVNIVCKVISDDLIDSLSGYLTGHIAAKIQPCIIWNGVNSKQVNNVSLDESFVIRGIGNQ
nr:13267_t:CDS:1 [Entrophospora candida]